MGAEDAEGGGVLGDRAGIVRENGYGLRLHGPDGDPLSQAVWLALRDGIEPAISLLQMSSVVRFGPRARKWLWRPTFDELRNACNVTPLGFGHGPDDNKAITSDGRSRTRVPVLKSRARFMQTIGHERRQMIQKQPFNTKWKREVEAASPEDLYREYIMHLRPQDLTSATNVGKTLARIVRECDPEKVVGPSRHGARAGLRPAPRTSALDEIRREMSRHRNQIITALNAAESPLKKYARALKRQRTMQKLGGMRPDR